MSQITVLGANSIPPGTFVETLTGNTGGAVGPSGTSNINIIGSGTISVTGNPGTNTLTISSSSSGGITTIDGDTGSVTGSTVSFIANPQAGSSVTFSGSGTTMSFNVTDGNFNTIIGSNAGNSAISGRFNTGLGEFALNSLVAGEYNTCIGLQAGYNYTGGSSNICIGAANFGVANEVNTLRIGNGTGSSSGNLAASYISGIQGVNVGSVASVVSIAASGDQLGTTTLTAGTGISITPGANSITIASSSAVNTNVFLAYIDVQQTGVTGAGAQTTVIFDGVTSNPGSNYNATTGIFTAPQTGNYLFTVNLSVGGTSAGASRAILYAETTSIEYKLIDDNFVQGAASGEAYFNASFMARLTSGNTCFIQIRVLGGAGNTLTCDGSSGGSQYTSVFSGYYVSA